MTWMILDDKSDLHNQAIAVVPNLSRTVKISIAEVDTAGKVKTDHIKLIKEEGTVISSVGFALMMCRYPSHRLTISYRHLSN